LHYKEDPHHSSSSYHDKCFGLLGIRGEATVVSISKEWFEVTEPPLPMPSLNKLMSINNKEELLNLSASQDGDPDSIRRLMVIPLMPLLLVAMSKVEDPLNLNAIYFAYKDSIDELVADGLESVPADLKIGLQFLWLVAHDPIPLDIPWISIFPAQDPFIARKYASIKKALFLMLTHRQYECCADCWYGSRQCYDEGADGPNGQSPRTTTQSFQEACQAFFHGH